ncbi:MAG: hypothetical protein ACR2QO_14695 [Acidimicrobiales bacterium]
MSSRDHSTSGLTTPVPVPDLLRGAWRRRSIVNADGTSDETSTVLWLQLQSKMVDVRFATAQMNLVDRGTLENCSLEDLRLLSTSESSSGHTTCTPVEIDGGGTRTATAEWFTRGYGVAFQPETAYPEPGLLEWSDDGSVMIERAPSGAYVEEWHRVPDSTAVLSHRRRTDGTQIYRAGSIAVIVRDRQKPVPRQARLAELVDDAAEDLDAVRDLVNCEFSLAERVGNDFVVMASTLPWRTGDVVDVAL